MKNSEVNKASSCLRCIYFIPKLNEGRSGCAAYLDKIPEKFLNGSAVHKKIEPDQFGDAVFTPLPDYQKR